MIVTFLTGHGKFNAHLKKMSVITDAKCKYCEEEETARHIMCDCDAYSALKYITMGKSKYQLKDYSILELQTFRKFCLRAYEKCWRPVE